MGIEIVIRNELLGMILEGARQLHPRETIVLLRGKSDKGVVNISEVVIPPLATYGKGFSGFHPHMLPVDFSIIGVAHSHPSGSLRPSVGDLNHPFGKVTIIIASPYAGRESVAIYDREGKRLTMRVT
jgi:proteasome lid subunit RPN8/RPN11